MLQQPPDPGPVLQRIMVKIDYLDGTSEELEAAAALQMGLPGAILIPQPRDGHVGVNVAAVKRWEAIPSAVVVVRGTN
jgi:hypothetical protein